MRQPRSPRFLTEHGTDTMQREGKPGKPQPPEILHEDPLKKLAISAMVDYLGRLNPSKCRVEIHVTENVARNLMYLARRMNVQLKMVQTEEDASYGIARCIVKTTAEKKLVCVFLKALAKHSTMIHCLKNKLSRTREEFIYVFKPRSRIKVNEECFFRILVDFPENPARTT